MRQKFSPFVLASVLVAGCFLAFAPIEKLHAAPPAADVTALPRLLALVDYIGGDYAAAVKAGAIVSAPEYAEMQNFSRLIGEQFAVLAPSLTAQRVQSHRANIASLQKLIELKADPTAVKVLSKTLRDELIRDFSVVTAPAESADFRLARESYANNCQSCHGVQGLGDGPAAATLDPPPRNFQEAELMETVTPFKFYNILPLGIPGTAMAAFAQMSEHERWSLAFYLTSLRHMPPQAWLEKRTLDPQWNPQRLWNELPAAQRSALEKSDLSVEFLARTSDEDLRAWLVENAARLHIQNAEKTLAALRVSFPFQKESRLQSKANGIAAGSPPSGGETPLTIDSAAELRAAAAGLEKANLLFAQGQHGAARDALLDAYLGHFEKVERLLKISHASQVRKVELLFLTAMNAAANGNAAEFHEASRSLPPALDEVAAVLETQKTSRSSAWGITFSSLVIILREGFEAFLIIAAFLALLQNMGANRAKIWIHAGWVSAVGMGGVTYFLFARFVAFSGVGREVTEAVCTLIASLVLFYVSYWMLSQSEKRIWERYLKGKTQNVLRSGKLWGLFGLSFLAVFREAAETVLFYQALVVNSAGSSGYVLVGFLAGGVVLAVMCSAIVRFGVRLPLRQFFLLTSLAMVAISVVFIGKGVHEFIEAGWLSPTLVHFVPTIDLLGIYPMLESLGAQFILGMAAVFLAIFMRRKKRQVPADKGSLETIVA